MNIIPKNNPAEFERFLFKEIDLYAYHHKFLLDYIEKARNGKIGVYDKSVINVSDTGWILILHSEILLIYGENWSTDQFEEIKEVIDLKIFKKFTVTGNSDLINALLNYFEIQNFSIDKERILYHSNKILNFENKKVKLEYGTQADLQEIALMLQQYYHEEYKGLNDKTISEMHERAFSVKVTRSVFILKNEANLIVGFCTIINPDVGILFIKNEHRKKGYGKVLLSYCSNLLLKKNNVVFVMTDKSEIPSNKVCLGLGFKPYYNYSMIEINCC